MSSFISKSIFLHLRLPFSLLLMPVYLFALSNLQLVNNSHALVVFIVLHFLVYPASNAYNSYFDKDEGSIALIKNPPKVNKSLYITAITLEWFAVVLSFLVSWQFVLGVILYNLLSKAYSHPSIRLKKYPITSFFVVFVFQGGFIYLLCFYAFADAITGFTTDVFLAALICSCLIGASYPLTQVYQHQEDQKRGDQTLSLLLGIKGSFLFSGFVFLIGLSLMLLFWYRQNQLNNFYVFAALSLPILIYFVWWFKQVLKDSANANFKNAMRMTMISGGVMLVYFLGLVLG